MLCSNCNKNTAVIFINKQMPDNTFKSEGLCFECAKKRGINPIEAIKNQSNISEEDLENMKSQLESVFKDMSENLNMDEIIDNQDIESFDENGEMPGGGIPIGAIFSNIFGGENKEGEETLGSSSGEKKKVKVDKKPIGNGKSQLTLVLV